MKYLLKQSGFTLIELMVGLVLGLVVTSALFWIYVGNIRFTTDSLKAARLNNDLRAAMELMVSDIRRAGYWGGVIDDSATPPVVKDLFDMEAGTDHERNRFTEAADGADIRIGNSGSCITYTYDEDGNGILAVDAETFGFKLDSDEVKIRKGGTFGGVNTICDDGSWEGITESDFVTITELEFRVTGEVGAPSSSCQNLDMSCSGETDLYRCGDPDATRCCWRSLCCDTSAAGYTEPHPGGAGTPPDLPDRLLESRVVAITLTGKVTGDDTVTKTLTEVVKVRNDRALRATACGT